MKKLTFLILFFVLPSRFMFAWSVDFVWQMPNNCSTMPSSYIVNSSSPVITVKYEIDCPFPIPCDTSFQVDIYLEQGSLPVFLARFDNQTRNDVITQNIQLSSTNFLVNSDAALNIVARSYANPGEVRSSRGYFRAYLNNSTNPITGYTALTNGTTTNIFNQNCSFYPLTSCHLAFGTYPVERYRQEWTITGNFTNKNIVTDNYMCMGYNPNNNPNYQGFWGQVVSKTNTSALLRTYVFKVAVGSNWEWWPCSPDKAALMYKVQDAPVIPVISTFTQNPFSIITNGSVQCHLSQGNGNLSYSWWAENQPSGVTISYNNQYANITRYFSDNNGPNAVMTEDRPLKLHCIVSNEAGSSTERTFVPSFGTINIGGCPFVFVYDTTKGFCIDNNILHRSELDGNYGNDIKDMYKLSKPPSVEDSVLRLAIKETESDYNYFDKFKLYAIDCSIWDRVVITENNDVAIYDIRTVASSEEAYKNTREITSIIQYDTSNAVFCRLVSGIIDDSIIAEYDVKEVVNRNNRVKVKREEILNERSVIDSLAIIAEVGANQSDAVPIAVKDYAGIMTIETDTDNYEKFFARREINCPIVIPISSSQDAASNVNIKWYRDFEIEYLSEVIVSYGNFTQTEVPLIDAWHSISGNILSNLQYTDAEYAEMDSSGYITLVFKNIPPPPFGKVRNYVIEVDGHYLLENIANNVRNRIDTKQNTLYKTNSEYQNKLIGNYPNPFNPTTNISYEINNPANVTLKIYNILGKEIATLVNEFKTAGTHQVSFDGSNLASGVYYYKIRASNFEQIKQMVLLK